MPKRIQLSRKRGWKKPPNCVVVSRPSVFGNPFTVAAAKEAGYLGSDEQLAAWCVSLFRRWLTNPRQMDYIGPVAEKRKAKLLARLPELQGKDLACWCKVSSPCHGDVLIELANHSGE